VLFACNLTFDRDALADESHPAVVRTWQAADNPQAQTFQIDGWLELPFCIIRTRRV
jgi:hypothetical protein